MEVVEVVTEMAASMEKGRADWPVPKTRRSVTVLVKVLNLLARGKETGKMIEIQRPGLYNCTCINP
jgi:hypothetical protein